MIAIIDYGMGNLRSVQKACEFVGHKAIVTSSPTEIEEASHVILPGVGAVRDALYNLKEKGLWQSALDAAHSGKPFLGICLGMQMLFDRSLENGCYDCLGLIGGQVVPFDVKGLRVPHMGWNSLSVKENPLISQGEKYVYFVHSYHAADVAEENIIATSHYGYPFVAAVQKGNIFGCQFHPEKSGDVGIEIIKNFGGM
ncbi:MAG: imidazole glycerol phosphate synthase subunit HisH [Christensenellaceae bacterium]|nr:imidazole glycerol phosphate synthase subunit HisH [Christensenellaceae bacterium]